jgi:SAM-dependent methyltransferase
MYMSLLCRYTDLKDRRRLGVADYSMLPPASLRYRVHGSPDAQSFLKVGKKSSGDIEAALEKVGRSLNSFRDVLDFGCGCGRTLVWFANRPPRFYGTDIDAEAISWCRTNLNFAEFGVNDALPPLEYPSEAFDLIYAISVFTHLCEDFQFRWLDELRRVARALAIVLLTLRGRRAWRDLPQEDIDTIKIEEFKFRPSNSMKDVFPDWYQNAYHTKKYVVDRYSEYFEVVDYIPRGMGRQDVVILRKP